MHAFVVTSRIFCITFLLYEILEIIAKDEK